MSRRVYQFSCVDEVFSSVAAMLNASLAVSAHD
jgi:hypothetical protein